MFFPHFLTSAIKAVTAFAAWPWNAPFTIALATLVWHGILRGMYYLSGWIDFEFADRERLAGRSPSDRQRFAGDFFASAVRYLIRILWVGVGVTLLWTPLAYYVSQSSSAPSGIRGVVEIWAEIAAPYLYPGDSEAIPVPHAAPPPQAPNDAGAVATPSFDCAKANKWAEHQVCDTPDLAVLDAQMGDVYRALMTPLPIGDARKQLRLEQRAWLAQRDQCETATDPIDCIRQAFVRRIGELKARIK